MDHEYQKLPFIWSQKFFVFVKKKKHIFYEFEYAFIVYSINVKFLTKMSSFSEVL